MEEKREKRDFSKRACAMLHSKAADRNKCEFENIGGSAGTVLQEKW